MTGTQRDGARVGLAAQCEGIWRESLTRLQAARLVSEALEAEPLPPGPVRVLALGKAAGPMVEAALSALGPRARDALCVLPEGSKEPRGARAIRGPPRARSPRAATCWRGRVRTGRSRRSSCCPEAAAPSRSPRRRGW